MAEPKDPRCTVHKEAARQMTQLADIYIGTAGYNYAHWRNDIFYPKSVKQADELRYYSGVFNAVEINASFHAVPRLETLQQWAEKAKEGFVFSFKVPQEITHIQRLVHIDSSLRYFLHRLIEGLGDKDRLGPILFQLPPSIAKNTDSLHEIGRILNESNLEYLLVAFEFRNKSWYCDEVYNVMQRYKFGLCENISPDNSTLHISDVIPSGTWHYIRFHKKADRGVTLYSDGQLQNCAQQLVLRRQHSIAQYCYFLNDHEGNGPRNAQSLVKFIQDKCPGRLVQQGHYWRPDSKTPTIQSMFANVSCMASIQKNEFSSKRKPTLSTPASKKRHTSGIQAYFPPATENSRSTPDNSSTKHPRQSASTLKKPANKSNTKTLESFFQNTCTGKKP